MLRSYDDFHKLENALASSGRLSRVPLPPMEPKGLRRLERDSCTHKGEEGLQKYLDHLAWQEGAAEDPDVMDSFSPRVSFICFPEAGADMVTQLV
jgi:hypothetical protein